MYCTHSWPGPGWHIGLQHLAPENQTGLFRRAQMASELDMLRRRGGGSPVLHNTTSRLVPQAPTGPQGISGDMAPHCALPLSSPPPADPRRGGQRDHPEGRSVSTPLAEVQFRPEIMRSRKTVSLEPRHGAITYRGAHAVPCRRADELGGMPTGLSVQSESWRSWRSADRLLRCGQLADTESSCLPHTGSNRLCS